MEKSVFCIFQANYEVALGEEGWAVDGVSNGNIIIRYSPQLVCSIGGLFSDLIGYLVKRIQGICLIQLPGYELSKQNYLMLPCYIIIPEINFCTRSRCLGHQYASQVGPLQSAMLD